MHIEFLVEDSSGAALLEIIIPKIIGDVGASHTWRIKSYKGVGKLPKDLNPQTDPAKRILLDRLPRLIAGYSQTPGIDWIVVVVDSDRRECRSFLSELQAVAALKAPNGKVLFRLAIEEIESWYFGGPSGDFDGLSKNQKRCPGQIHSRQYLRHMGDAGRRPASGWVGRPQEIGFPQVRCGETHLGQYDWAGDGS